VGSRDLATNPGAWVGVSWGVVESFAKKMLVDGYAVGTVNNHLSTIKTYAKLATKAGILDTRELAMIRMVSGYSHKEAQRIDEKREDAGMETRIGDKKEDFRVLSETQEARLKSLCDESPQGLRDRAMLVLLLDLGLRVSEAEELQADNFDPEDGKLVVYRRKTDKTTTFELRNGKLAAMRSYFQVAHPQDQLLRGSRKGGRLVGGMSKRAIRARVRALGEEIGVDRLSPHDLRHTRATRLASWLNVRELMDWFGWNSPAMAARYIESVQHITVE
jgi:integrase